MFLSLGILTFFIMRSSVNIMMIAIPVFLTWGISVVNMIFAMFMRLLQE